MFISSKHRGVTLVELLVSLVIISILASVALPYAEISVRRKKEVELHRSLRHIRTAIDEFHADWNKGMIPASPIVASDNGYPTQLNVLTEGVKLSDGKFKRYLRRIPTNPFFTYTEGESGWRLVGYEEKSESLFWNERDVYDVKFMSEQKALNGSQYKDW